MPRVPMLVRDAVTADASALGRLWPELGPELGSELDSEHGSAAAAVRRVQDDPDTRLLVAELDGAVVGCAFLRVGLASPLRQDRAVHLSHLQVDSRFARRGAGRQLIEATLAWAEQCGIDALLVFAPVNDREANRALARLGLQQVAVVRGASVAAMRARMPQAPAVVARDRRVSRTAGQVVAVRRLQRRAAAQRAQP